MCLRQLGEDGRALWHEWSAGSPKYDPAVLDAKWETFAPGTEYGVSLGTLIVLARDDDRLGPSPRPQGPAGRAVSIHVRLPRVANTA
jgi:hypothetical protein